MASKIHPNAQNQPNHLSEPWAPSSLKWNAKCDSIASQKDLVFDGKNEIPIVQRTFVRVCEATEKAGTSVGDGFPLGSSCFICLAFPILIPRPLCEICRMPHQPSKRTATEFFSCFFEVFSSLAERGVFRSLHAEKPSKKIPYDLFRIEASSLAPNLR